MTDEAAKFLKQVLNLMDNADLEIKECVGALMSVVHLLYELNGTKEQWVQFCEHSKSAWSDERGRRCEK